jgi:hypothetical protein
MDVAGIEIVVDWERDRVAMWCSFKKLAVIEWYLKRRMSSQTLTRVNAPLAMGQRTLERSPNDRWKRTITICVVFGPTFIDIPEGVRYRVGSVGMLCEIDLEIGRDISFKCLVLILS